MIFRVFGSNVDHGAVRDVVVKRRESLRKALSLRDLDSAIKAFERVFVWEIRQVQRV